MARKATRRPRVTLVRVATAKALAAVLRVNPADLAKPAAKKAGEKRRPK
jgi:hypothetical protein